MPQLCDIKISIKKQSYSQWWASHVQAELSACPSEGGSKSEQQSHAAEAHLQRGETTPALGELPAVPRRRHIEQPVERGEQEILEIAEPEVLPQMEEEIIEVIGDRVNVQPGQDEAGGFELAG